LYNIDQAFKKQRITSNSQDNWQQTQKLKRSINEKETIKKVPDLGQSTPESIKKGSLSLSKNASLIQKLPVIDISELQHDSQEKEVDQEAPVTRKLSHIVRIE
jgi:hypothetical protein